MEHPLNRPRRDPATGLVCGGYGILQPRVGISLSSGPRSGYARLFGSDAGIDPYTRAVSDLYQDAFEEGSFIGKGIYDVDAFEGALAGRFPDNAILSHDLIEGCHARSGLVSDLQLYEDYPSTYRSDASRRERWIRGDWQLLPWLLPWAPNEQGRWQRNPLGVLSRWKMFDNLRRSLVAPALLALLLAAWFALRAPLAWTLALMALPFLPLLASSLQELLSKPRELRLLSHLRLVAESLRRQLARARAVPVLAAARGLGGARAIGRTLVAHGLSRRGLLEWQSSSDVERAGGDDLAPTGGAWRSRRARARRRYRTGLVAARSLAGRRCRCCCCGWRRRAWPGGRAAPVAADGALALAPAQQRELRRLARKTWRFFERHVCEQDNWLPPDNMQEVPAPTIAHRTSPTNIGLALLSNLAAHDFGYLGIGELLVRSGNTLRAMDKLERHRGHFLNWYDTLTLRPLPPRYISSVDSGNLAGHLLVLRAGLLALADAPLLHPRIGEGLLDTLAALEPAFGGQLPGDAAALRERLAAAPLSARMRRRCCNERARWPSSCRPIPPRPAIPSARIGRRRCPASAIPTSRTWSCCIPGSGRTPAVAWSRRRACARWPQSSWRRCGEPEREAMAPARALARRWLAEIEAQAEQAADFAHMQYQFLYDSSRHLLSIGYNLDERRLDASFYDLLASESRLASFVAIAQGHLPQEGWFALGGC
jgi:hypothetical protein